MAPRPQQLGGTILLVGFASPSLMPSSASADCATVIVFNPLHHDGGNVAVEAQDKEPSHCLWRRGIGPPYGIMLGVAEDTFMLKRLSIFHVQDAPPRPESRRDQRRSDHDDRAAAALVGISVTPTSTLARVCTFFSDSNKSLSTALSALGDASSCWNVTAS